MTDARSPRQTMTLAQLSDLHLGPLPPIPLKLLDAKRLTGALNWYGKRRRLNRPEQADAWITDLARLSVDHVAVTGDLCNIGLPAEIERGGRYLARLGPPERVSVIPGNHDIYSTFGGKRLGAAALASWAPYMASDAAGGRYATDGGFPFVRVLASAAFRVALIGLNTAVETPPAIATGRLGTDQLRRLETVLAATAADEMVRVVLMHHPPLASMARAHHELLDGDALGRVLQRCGADLVIHGHNHRAMFNRMAGPTTAIPVVGVPSASAAFARPGEDLARAHLFEIEKVGTATRVTLIARGLARAGGPIVDIDRRVLTG